MAVTKCDAMHYGVAGRTGKRCPEPARWRVESAWTGATHDYCEGHYATIYKGRLLIVERIAEGFKHADE